MNICFPLAGKVDIADQHARGAVLIRSIRHFMPHASITQVSDEHYPAVPGVDAVLRHPWRKGLDWIQFRFEALDSYAKKVGEHLQLETDIVVRRDVSYVMEGDFDVAMCVTPDRKDAVLNGGVMFCKNPLLYAQALGIYNSRPDLQDGWEGGQTAQSIAARSMRCEFLDFDTYNFTPAQAGIVPPSAQIVHYRGRRKLFMAKDNPEFAREYAHG